MESNQLGKIMGTTITAKMPAIFSTLLLWLIFGAAGYLLFDLSAAAAIGGGLIAAVLHWLSDLLHQSGHVRAARRTGWPMQRLHFHWFLIASLYPRDEPELPASIHVRRALGGIPVSLLLSLVGFLLTLALQPSGGLPLLLSQFFFWENLLVFGLGALLPLGFTDGSTLIKWLPRLRQERQQRG